MYIGVIMARLRSVGISPVFREALYSSWRGWARLSLAAHIFVTFAKKQHAHIVVTFAKKQHAHIVVTFAKKLSTKQEQAMNLLEEFEKILSDASVNELSTTITKALSLLDDPMTEPKIPTFVVTDCEDPAEDTEVGKEE